MAHINLLPWRAEERERKNRDFISWLALAFITAGAIAFFVWYLFNLALDDQRQANTLIETENAKLDTKLEQIADLEVRREAIISRMKVVQDLQGRRPVPVHVWHDVASAVPEAMYLISFSRTDDFLTFEGRAANPNVVSNLVSNLDASPWMQNAAVRNIQKEGVVAYNGVTNTVNSRPEDGYVSFVVTTNIVTTLPEDMAEDVQAGDTLNSDMSMDSNAINTPINSNEANEIASESLAIEGGAMQDTAPTANNQTATQPVANDPNGSNANTLGANADGINTDNVASSTATTGDATDADMGSDVNITNNDPINNTEGEVINDNSIQGNPSIEGQAAGGLT